MNVDETTHGFADKIYDRAPLIELTLSLDVQTAHVGNANYHNLIMQLRDLIAHITPFA